MTSRDIFMIAVVVFAFAVVIAMVWLAMQPPPIGYGMEHIELSGVWRNGSP